MIWFAGKLPNLPRCTSLKEQSVIYLDQKQWVVGDVRVGLQLNDFCRIRRKPKGDILIGTDVGVHGER